RYRQHLGTNRGSACSRGVGRNGEHKHEHGCEAESLHDGDDAGAASNPACAALAPSLAARSTPARHGATVGLGRGVPVGCRELGGERGVVPLGSEKQRTLLAALLIHANEVVSHDRLIEELWGEEPPASASHSIDAYVSRLRSVLKEAGGYGLLKTRGSGYMLA